jgi:hypothetical protein
VCWHALAYGLWVDVLARGCIRLLAHSRRGMCSLAAQSSALTTEPEEDKRDAIVLRTLPGVRGTGTGAGKPTKPAKPIRPDPVGYNDLTGECSYCGALSDNVLFGACVDCADCP